jgi:hypothetical protein
MADDKVNSAVATSASNSESETHQEHSKENYGSTFASGGLAKDHYKPVQTYEGIHRYDPDFEWELAEEKRVVRKVRIHFLDCHRLNKTCIDALQIDLRIWTWVCLMFFALQLDRGNISQALSDNMLDDLGLNTNDYNYGQTIFYLSPNSRHSLSVRNLGPTIGFQSRSSCGAWWVAYRLSSAAESPSLHVAEYWVCWKEASFLTISCTSVTFILDQSYLPG